MARFKKVPQLYHEGKINYGKGIIDGIVFLAVNELEFVKFAFPKEKTKKTSDIINVNLNKNIVNVDVKIMIHFSQSVSDTAFKVQEAIRHNIETMTEYKVNSVNVNVCGVFFEDKEQEVNKETNKQTVKEEKIENTEDKKN